MMLVKFSEQTVASFRIPSFMVEEGDLIVIRLPNGPYFRPVALSLIDMLRVRQQSDLVEVRTPLKYAEHMIERPIRSRFFPMTVGAFLKRNGNKADPFYNAIYAEKWITPKTKVQELAGTQRRALSIYAALSRTPHLMFDLPGVDPCGAQQIYNVVRNVVRAGGSAILFDHSDEFRNDCTQFIQPEYVGDAE